tara:strand:- start:4773 stop:5039 length:267 start_codon:yes stop_codon:yes gene_type:complete
MSGLARRLVSAEKASLMARKPLSYDLSTLSDRELNLMIDLCESMAVDGDAALTALSESDRAELIAAADKIPELADLRKDLATIKADAI